MPISVGLIGFEGSYKVASEEPKDAKKIKKEVYGSSFFVKLLFRPHILCKGLGSKAWVLMQWALSPAWGLGIRGLALGSRELFWNIQAGVGIPRKS